MTPPICQRCVMDSSAPDLGLDGAGVCRYCREYEQRRSLWDFPPAEQLRRRESLLHEIRRAGLGHRYDCVMGLSGGVDSSYAVYVARKSGLRPLVVHVDNGWNTELAVMNIENIVRKLELDLVTIVIDWDEFRELQLAHLRAGVVDLELPSDHAIVAGMVKTARRFGARFILTGDNYATEATLPKGWNHRKTDLRNLRAVHDAYTSEGLASFPQISTLGLMLRQKVLGLRYVGLLSYFPYVKAEAIQTLTRELGWRAYGGKHYESIITRFYQGYILPTKFGIDKRRLHFSLLINAGQMTREAALAELARPTYDPDLAASDREFVIKKFRITEAEFEKIMREPPRAHLDFASDEPLLTVLRSASRVRAALTRVLR